MAETEVSKEVPKMVAIEEKCVLDMSSYQDLPKPDCNGTNHRNQANDLDNSYVFVSGTDGVTEYVGNEDSKVMLESDAAGVKDQGPELHSHIDAVSRGIKPPNEAEGIIERSTEEPPLNEENSIIELGNGDVADNKNVDAEDLSVLPESSAAGVEDQQADLHSQIEKIDVGDPPLVNVDNKDVEVEVLSVLPEPDTAVVKDQGTELHSQIEKENADIVEFQPLNEAENSITERSNGDLSLANFDIKVVEAEDLSVLPDSDASGVKDQGAEMHSQINEVNVNFHPLNEAENSITGDPPLVTVDNKDVVEDEGSSVLPESGAAVLKDQEVGLHSQIENIDEVSQPLNGTDNCIVEQNNCESPLVNVKNTDVETEGLSVPQECDSAGVKEQVAELDPQSFLNIDNKDVETEGSSVEFQHNAAEINDPGAELVSQNESFDAVESRNVEQIKEDTTSKHESFLENDEGVQVSLDDPLVEHAVGTKTETEVNDVQDSDGKTESLAEAEVEKALDQNGIVEDVAEGKEEKLDDASKSESSQIPVENQVSQVVALGLVAEPGENMESNNILLHIDNSLGANDKCEDKSNLCVTEALEVHHESQDVVQHELQDVTVNIDDEVKSVREVLEPVEALDEEAKTTLSSEVLENQQDETAFDNNVQGVLGQMDRSITVGSSTDSHVQTVCNLAVEEQNENFRVSEMDSGVQYPEDAKEQPDSNGVSHDTIPSETKTEASMQAQSYPVSDAHAPQSEISDVETVGTAPIILISEVTENISPCHDSGIRCPDEVVLTEMKPASQGDEAHAETEVSSGKVEAAVNKEVANVMLDIEGTEDIRDQLDDTIDSGNENLLVQENEDTVNSQHSKVSVASAEGSRVHTSDGKEQSVKIKTKPFNFLIRVPRFDDENLREQIRVAKIHVDEKTKLRDAVQIQIQEKRANSQVHGIDYEYAKSEARSARKLVRSKRMEIDSLQSVINKAKNASSIEDIDSQIYNMEHMIQHETLPLKEEKQLIREIKQLKQLREQLSSNMGSQDEIKQAIEQRGQVEERLKILRKELDVLKNRVLNAEATATEAGKKYDDENKKVKELQAQFRAADDVRQAAYAQWQNLRKELSKKSEYFFKYKDDAAVASNYAYSRDTEALYFLCTNQVDNFMELWNINADFRREYAKFNTRSTVRRFGTLDGRALGPDEVAPRLPSYADERVSRMASTSVKVDLASRVPSPEVKLETRNENTAVDNKVTKKAMESNYQKVTKEAAISVQANGLDDTHYVEVYKEAVRSKEEIESLRMEEEKKREEVEAKLKEQRRVEALVKANEARERKKRQAEKLQMRANLKTQKEAEQREKEREKRLRKKERKKGGVTTDGNDMKSMNCESGPSSESAAESSKDIDVVVNEAVSKRQQAQKPWLLGKQSKGKSIPPPLRNRNKKKLQQWMWVGVTSVMILVLFWLGNIGVFSNVALKRRGPVL